MPHLFLAWNYLAIAAITTTAASGTTVASASARATTATATTSAGPSATASAISASAMGTVASWTLRSARSYGFTVCLFAIKVRLAAFIIVEVAATFKGDSFFAFAAWSSRRTLTAAFAARTLT